MDADHEKIISRLVKLIPDNGTTNDLASKIKNCPLAMMRGDPSGLVMYLFDSKKFGESVQRPDIRPPPFREGLYNRLVQTVLQSRKSKVNSDSEEPEEATLCNGEFALLFDGGKRGLTSKLQAPWKAKSTKSGKDLDVIDENEVEGDDAANMDDANAPKIVSSMLNIGYDADSVAARKKIVRGTMSLKQLEGAAIMSYHKISLPEKPWGHYPGTNHGDSLLGVILPPFTSPEVWKLTWKLKKALYGKRHLIAVGGRTQDMPPLDKRTDDKIEPVVYNPTPMLMYDAIIKGFFVKFVFDLTPVDSTVGWTCIANNIAYIGICFTEEHCELLFQRFIDLLKVEMANPDNSILYNAAYAVAINKKKAEQPNTVEPKPPKPNRKPKATGKPRAKPKARPSNQDDASENADGDDDNVSDDDDDEVWDPLAE